MFRKPSSSKNELSRAGFVTKPLNQVSVQDYSTTTIIKYLDGMLFKCRFVAYSPYKPPVQQASSNLAFILPLTVLIRISPITRKIGEQEVYKSEVPIIARQKPPLPILSIVP